MKFRMIFAHLFNPVFPVVRIIAWSTFNNMREKRINVKNFMIAINLKHELFSISARLINKEGRGRHEIG